MKIYFSWTLTVEAAWNMQEGKSIKQGQRVELFMFLHNTGSFTPQTKLSLKFSVYSVLLVLSYLSVSLACYLCAIQTFHIKLIFESHIQSYDEKKSLKRHVSRWPHSAWELLTCWTGAYLRQAPWRKVSWGELVLAAFSVVPQKWQNNSPTKPLKQFPFKPTEHWAWGRCAAAEVSHR